MIDCLVCGRVKREDETISREGWRLAPNRIGGYTCGPVCDDIVTAYDAKKKADADAEKKLKKARAQ